MHLKVQRCSALGRLGSRSALTAVSLSSAFLCTQPSQTPSLCWSLAAPDWYHPYITNLAARDLFLSPICFYKNLKCVSVVWCGSPCSFLIQQLWSMRWRFWVTGPGCGSSHRGGTEGELALPECMFWKRRRDLGAVTRKGENGYRASDSVKNVQGVCRCWTESGGWERQPSQCTGKFLNI